MSQDSAVAVAKRLIRERPSEVFAHAQVPLADAQLVATELLKAVDDNTSLIATQAQAIIDRDLAWRRLTALATAARAARDWMQHDLEEMAGSLVVPTREEQPLAQIIAKIDPNDPGFPIVAELQQLLDGLDVALSECPA